ncbi:ALMS1 protein, partial [Toxostoma redivivum]|nr:ALMS1 protein [Toxostoma redivivum]
SALSRKRRSRMLSKGIQAGALEIVSSATKRNTRDVGVTFPTPRSSLQLQEPPWHQPWAQQGTDRHGTRRSRLHFQQGPPRLVPEDPKRGSRTGIPSLGSAGPGPAWFEPLGVPKTCGEPPRDRGREPQP